MNVLTIKAGARGVDYSSARPSPAALKALGYEFVFRYLTGGFPGKQTTLPELEALWAAGIAVVLNGETGSGAALGGAVPGAADGLAFVAAARKLGAPPGTCIVVSDDTGAWNAQVVPYLRAAYDVILAAGYTFGLYGDGQVIQACLDAGMVLTIIWATGSWAWPGGIHPQAHVRQGGQIQLNGALDLNVARRPFGAWLPEKYQINPPVTEPAPPVVKPLPKDSTMFLVFTLNDLGVWLIDFTENTITHLDGPHADLYQKLGFPNNFPEAQRVSADELAMLQAVFVGRPQAHLTDGPRQITGTFVGTAA